MQEGLSREQHRVVHVAPAGVAPGAQVLQAQHQGVSRGPPVGQHVPPHVAAAQHLVAAEADPILPAAPADAARGRCFLQASSRKWRHRLQVGAAEQRGDGEQRPLLLQLRRAGRGNGSGRSLPALPCAGPERRCAAMSNMEKHLFNLKFAAKELNRNSKRCDKEEKAEKAKIKKAIQKGNMEVARIHAENAIRQKNQAINFLRMSARVDAVAARVQTAVTMGKVTKSMAGVVKSMDATLKSMNLEKISALMDKFEHQFETLDVQTQQMEDTMSNTTTLTTPQNQVDMLLQEMADEAGLDLNMELPQGQTGSVGTSVASAEQDELSQRLARLRDQV